MEAEKSTLSRLSLDVAAVLEKKVDRRKKWGLPEWSLHSVVTGEQLDQTSEPVTIHEQSDDEVDLRRTLHGGLKLELFKDGSEGYWYNLLSQDPYIFVVCEGEPNAPELIPFFVTVNQDEATGHLETDDIVLSAPMPSELRGLLERYVMDHYEPMIKRKRKRKDWLEDSLYAGKKH